MSLTDKTAREESKKHSKHNMGLTIKTTIKLQPPRKETKTYLKGPEKASKTPGQAPPVTILYENI